MSTENAWRPAIKNPGAYYLHEQYGITEERRLELSAVMEKLFSGGETGCIAPVANHIDKIAVITETAGEFAFCLFIHTVYLCTSRSVSMPLS